MELIKCNIEIENIKRCYIDLRIMIPCPKCNTQLIADFNKDYLSYPVLGKLTSGWVYCKACKINITYPLMVKAAQLHILVDPWKAKID